MLLFTSLVPVLAGLSVSGSHSQKSISNLQDNSVNKVPGEGGTVSNRFDSVSWLEPGSPCAPCDVVTLRIPIEKLPVNLEGRPLTCDHGAGLSALDVTSPSPLDLRLVRQLVAPRRSHQTHLQEELSVSATPVGAAD